jgi:RHS repeat-associated protein
MANPLGEVTGFQSNRAGVPTASTDPSGATWTVEHDARGRVRSITDPLGAVTSLRYDGEGRPVAQTYPDGSSETWAWDPDGILTAHIDQAGNTTGYEVGPFERITARTDPDGARYEFTHDSELRLSRVTAPGGLAWSYSYDAAGNLLGERDFNGRELTYEYDAAGQLAQRINGTGQRITFARDAMGRITERDADGTPFRYDYDPAGRLTRASNPAAAVEYTRDPAGRALTESVNGAVTEFAYDAMGRITRRGTPSGTTSQWVFGPAGLPTSLTTSAGALSFQYDAAGRETLRALGSAAALSLEYDAAGRLGRQAVWSYDQTGSAPARTVQVRSFAYRPDGYPARIDDQLRGTRSYSLDPSGRVTAVESAGWRESYAYDAMGNLARSAVPGDEDAQVGEREISGTLTRRVGRTSFEYDGQGRVIRTVRRTLSGQAHTRSYTWDADDQLTAVTNDDGSSHAYSYDPLGRRLTKERRNADGETVEHTRFTWDATCLIEQITVGPDGRANALTWDHEPDSHRPVAQTRRRWALDAPQAEIDAAFHAVITDPVGTPTELVTPDGEIVWRADTTIWGRPIEPPGASRAEAVDCPLRFPGQYHDPETGWSYNLFRHYDPETAAYSAPDPLGLDPAPNHHAYVVNPLAWLDPLGLAGGTLKYVTYTKTDSTGNVYSGRSMGTGTPTQIVADRNSGHHMTGKGYGPAVLDQSLDATKPYADRHSDPNYQAIRGREQDLIQYHGGAQSEGGTSGNAINGVGPDNPLRTTYMDASKNQFGAPGGGCP